MCLEVIPQLAALGQCLLAAVQRQEDAGDCHHHREIVQHVGTQLGLLRRQGVDIDRVHHNAGDAQLLVNALDHVGLVDALILAPDEVAVEVKVHVVDGFDLRQRLVDEDVVNIEGVLGQLHAAAAQHLGAVDDAVHQDVFVRRELADLLPGENAAFGQDALVVDDVAGVVGHMLIDIVGHHQIKRLLVVEVGAQLGQDLLQGIGVEPVVGVDDLEVDAGGIADALVDALAVAAVLLMYGFYDGGVLFGVGVGNFAGVVLGAVIHKDDLGVLPRGEQGLDAVIHIGSRVVARHGKGDEFHRSLLLKGIIYLL